MLSFGGGGDDDVGTMLQTGVLSGFHADSLLHMRNVVVVECLIINISWDV